MLCPPWGAVLSVQTFVWFLCKILSLKWFNSVGDFSVLFFLNLVKNRIRRKFHSIFKWPSLKHTSSKNERLNLYTAKEYSTDNRTGENILKSKSLLSSQALQMLGLNHTNHWRSHNFTVILVQENLPPKRRWPVDSLICSILFCVFWLCTQSANDFNLTSEYLIYSRNWFSSWLLAESTHKQTRVGRPRLLALWARELEQRHFDGC